MVLSILTNATLVDIIGETWQVQFQMISTFFPYNMQIFYFYLINHYFSESKTKQNKQILSVSLVNSFE